MSENVQIWHMQMFPSDDSAFAEKYLPKILQQRQFIGLGDWQDDQKGQIEDFCQTMQIGDIVAIKNGGRLMALVQVLGGVYQVREEQNPQTAWIIYRRPVRILDWEIEDKSIPQPRGTLNRCVNEDVETTKILTDWYQKVKVSFEKRGISLFV